jgi:hypothetical protein
MEKVSVDYTSGIPWGVLAKLLGGSCFSWGQPTIKFGVRHIARDRTPRNPTESASLISYHRLESYY